MAFTINEQEIVIVLNGKDENIMVSTTYPHWIKRLDKYCEENPDEWKKTYEYEEDGRVVSAMYEAPKSLLSKVSRYSQMTGKPGL